MGVNITPRGLPCLRRGEPVHITEGRWDVGEGQEIRPRAGLNHAYVAVHHHVLRMCPANHLAASHVIRMRLTIEQILMSVQLKLAFPRSRVSAAANYRVGVDEDIPCGVTTR